MPDFDSKSSTLRTISLRFSKIIGEATVNTALFHPSIIWPMVAAKELKKAKSRCLPLGMQIARFFFAMNNKCPKKVFMACTATFGYGKKHKFWKNGYLLKGC